MFRETSPQRPLFGVAQRLDDEKRARLEKSWAHAYQSKALGLIDETRFAKYFDPGNGRPNKSVRLVVSVLVLFAMGFYLGRYGGSWSTVAHEADRKSVV